MGAVKLKYLGAGIAALLIVAIAARSFLAVQAEEYGYYQADCPTIVKQAIDTVGSECTKAGRNKLCYGNSTIQAQFQPGASNVTFQSPGDTVDVSQIKQFTLGGMDTATNTWGMAEMRIKADLPDTDPTQAVTMILFGDVQLTDGSSDANATATIQAAGTATHMPPVPAGLRTQTAIAVKRQATLAATVSPSASSQQIASGSGGFGAMQAFYFQSSDTAPCEQAPHDGILIQSPQGGKQRVTLSIDGAIISLGSTVYITAQPSKFLTVNTLEGSVTVTAAGQTQTVTPGTAVQVPLDANLRASGAPTTAGFYSTDTVRALPIQVLPTTAVVFAPGVPSNMTFAPWTYTDNPISGACVGRTGEFTTQINLAYNNSGMWWSDITAALRLGGNAFFSRASSGQYILTIDYPYGGAGTWSLQVDNAAHISGTGTVSQTGTHTGIASCTDSIVLTPTTTSTASPAPTA